LQVIQVYLDQPLLGLLLGWIQDLALLWVVGQISVIKVSLKRLALGGISGGIYNFFLLTNQISGGILNHWVLSPLIYFIMIPAVMAFLAFFPVNLKKFIGIVGYIYLLSFVLAGFHWGIDILNQEYFQLDISLWWQFLFHLALIFIMGELGWGVVHRKFLEETCLYPVLMSWGEDEIELNALLDTGNGLFDPLTKMPVIIVELDRIKNLLPDNFLSFIKNMQSGESSFSDLPEFWLKRILILPFNSIGEERGILVGFRLDQVVIRKKQYNIVKKNVVVGLCDRSLSKEGIFQALLPPSVLM
jgi:stage II sporulation protein GA (sporulation sigma-E factor processing peptidase)